jgi:hypothetical protein
MFRALLAHPQEALHKRYLVYCVRVMSAGCTRIEVEHSNAGAANMHITCTIAVSLQSWHTQLTLHPRNIPSAFCVAPPEDEQVMLETCRGP